MKNLFIIVLGSSNDLGALKDAKLFELLGELGIEFQVHVFSAHRHPKELRDFIEECLGNGVQLFAGIAGMAADLPKAITSYARGYAMVFGIPLTCSTEDPTGIYALMSITLAPGGIPVSTQGIGQTGIKNTALQVAQVLSFSNEAVRQKLIDWHFKNPKVCGQINPETGVITPADFSR